MNGEIRTIEVVAVGTTLVTSLMGLLFAALLHRELRLRSTAGPCRCSAQKARKRR